MKFAFLDFFGFIRCETKWWNNVRTWGDALYIKKNRLSFQKTIYLKIKNRTELIKGYFFIKKFVLSFNFKENILYDEMYEGIDKKNLTLKDKKIFKCKK